MVEIMSYFKLSSTYLAVFDFGRAMGAFNMPSGAEVLSAVRDLNTVQRNEIVIGGLAVGYYGYERSTTNLDLLYEQSDESNLFARLNSAFQCVRRRPNGWHHFEHRATGLPLKLVPAGYAATNGPIPSPSELISKNGMVSLSGLIWLKIVSGRMKDTADIIELAKRRKLTSVASEIPQQYRQTLEHIVVQAARELDNDPNFNSAKGHRAKVPGMRKTRP